MKTLQQNSNRAPVKSTNDLSFILQDVLARAKAHGATDASVSVSHDTGFSVDVRMGSVETVAFSEEKGIGVTVYIDKRKGSASSSDTSSSALESMVLAAIDIAKVSASDPCFGLPEAQLMSSDYPDLDLYHPWDLTPPDAIEMALHCEQYARSLDKRITNSDGVNVSTYAFSNGFANTQGAFGVVDSTRHSISCSLIAVADELMQRDYDYTTSRMMKGLIPLEQLATSAVGRVVSRLGARKLKTQKSPVLFSSRLSSSLLSAFIGAISGSNLYRKSSFLLDSIGQQLFPRGIRVYEQPHVLRALGSSSCDGEGVLTRDNVIVEDGMLCQYVLGCYSARKLGLQTTGNSGGVFNLTVDPTAGDLSDLLKKMGTGLFVTELMGNGINGLTGDYSRGASGFWVENGDIQYPVEEITIAGNLKDMFRSIAGIGHDINPNIATRCGSILIEDMMIAGE
jgi:PmbA protein